jgi:hypothetical protein
MSDEGNSYRTQYPEPDWHQLAEQASQESDPRKLSHLIKALCDRLQELQTARRAFSGSEPSRCEGDSKLQERGYDRKSC